MLTFSGLAYPESVQVSSNTLNWPDYQKSWYKIPETRPFAGLFPKNEYQKYKRLTEYTLILGESQAYFDNEKTPTQAVAEISILGNKSVLRVWMVVTDQGNRDFTQVRVNNSWKDVASRPPLFYSLDKKSYFETGRLNEVQMLLYETDGKTMLQVNLKNLEKD